MSIAYLDGVRWKRGILAGSRALFDHTDILNEINVFPVADSDTGTNMSGTMRSMVEALHPHTGTSLSEAARTAADSAVIGAKGNSGTILAQYFHGFAEAFSGKIRVSTRTFGEAARRAVDAAYRSIHTPKDGTLLSVMRDWAETVYEHCRLTDDFVELLGASVEAARNSLEKTREQLEVLKKANVVDAGAMGFVRFVEGIWHYMRSGSIEEIETIAEPYPVGHDRLAAALEEPEFRYCTECVVHDVSIDTPEISRLLEPHGDSIIVAGSKRLAKIHIHTDTPGEVFALLEGFGTIGGQKADDMKRQFDTARSDRAACVVVVDSTCDLPEELFDELDIHIVPIQVLFGTRTFLDRVALKSGDFYRMMRDHPDIIPSTSQPRVADYTRTLEFLLDHTSEIVVLTIAEKLSGTINAARNAIASLDPADRERVTLIDTTTVSVAFGLIAKRVAEAVRGGIDASEAAALARDLVSRTEVYLTVPSLDNLVRSGRVSRMKGVVARLFNLKPVLRVGADGSVEKAGTVFGVRGGRKKLLAALKRAHETSSHDEPIDIAIGHVEAPDDVAWLIERIEETIDRSAAPLVTEVSPALATHAGSGAVALAFIGPRS